MGSLLDTLPSDMLNENRHSIDYALSSSWFHSKTCISVYKTQHKLKLCGLDVLARSIMCGMKDWLINQDIVVN